MILIYTDTSLCFLWCSMQSDHVSQLVEWWWNLSLSIMLFCPCTLCSTVWPEKTWTSSFHFVWITDAHLPFNLINLQVFYRETSSVAIMVEKETRNVIYFTNTSAGSEALLLLLGSFFFLLLLFVTARIVLLATLFTDHPAFHFAN